MDSCSYPDPVSLVTSLVNVFMDSRCPKVAQPIVGNLEILHFSVMK